MSEPNGNGTSKAIELRPDNPLLRRGDPPSLGKLSRWLEDHDDEGVARAAYVELVYQTVEHSAEERAPTKADLWMVNYDLDVNGRRARFLEIAEKAWNQAHDTMANAKVAHLWRVIRRNEDDQAIGVFTFKLFAEGERFDEGADPPNEKGALAAHLRVFNTGNSLAFQQILSMQRLQLERESEDRREILESRRQMHALFQSMQDALDRKAAREVELKKAEFDLEIKKDMYGAISKGIELIMAKNAPVQQHINEFVKDLDKDTLIKIAEALPTDEQRQKLFAMLNAFAEAEERQRKVAEDAAKKEAEEKAKEQKELKP